MRGLMPAEILPAPCKDCRLSPCGRRSECPRWRKWQKRLAAIRAELKAEQAAELFVIEVKINGMRHQRNLNKNR